MAARRSRRVRFMPVAERAVVRAVAPRHLAIAGVVDVAHCGGSHRGGGTSPRSSEAGTAWWRPPAPPAVPRRPRRPQILPEAPLPSPLAAPPPGRPPRAPGQPAVAWAWASAPPRSVMGARAITGGVNVWARQIEHSCSKRWMTSSSNRAKAWRRLPECINWRGVARNLAISCQSSGRTSGMAASRRL